jgi:hypothetical protein
MVTNVFKVDSNTTNTRYAEEASIGVLPSSPVWNALEPNSFSNFGGQIKTVARRPINTSRQRFKGVLVDLDAGGTVNSDVTQTNMQDIMQGFFFASLRRKGEVGTVNEAPISVTGASHLYTVQSTAGVLVGSLVLAAHFGLAANNGLKRVTAVSAAVAAQNTLTQSTTFTIADGETVTIGSTVYTFKTVLTDTVAGQVLIDATGASPETNSFANLAAAINGSAGAGSLYSGATPPDANVTATSGTHTLVVTARNSGTTPNAVATTETLVHGAWAETTLGGAMATTVGASGTITVSDTSVVDETVSTAATLVVVGFQTAAGDLDVTATAGDLPHLTSTALDFTTLGLTPGEFIWLGGDTAITNLLTAANSGWGRVHSAATNLLVLDKTGSTFVTEANAAQTVQIFFGRVLKNELDPALQKRRTYQIERTLGAPDFNHPTQLQSEYIIGGVPSKADFMAKTADKFMVDLEFVGLTNEQRTATTGLKSGTRPDLSVTDAFNTTSHVSRMRMTILDPVNSNPLDLFFHVQDFNIPINNTLTPNKAIRTLGAFEVTAGLFAVDGKATAYFSDVQATLAVRQNKDVTFDAIFVRQSTAGNYAGVAFDVPLIALGDARLNVVIDKAIDLPLEIGAARDRNFNHTLLMTWYDYLPAVAAPVF